jgi:hypothetical protein
MGPKWGRSSVATLGETVEYVLANGQVGRNIGRLGPAAAIPAQPAKPRNPDELVAEDVIGGGLVQPAVAEDVVCAAEVWRRGCPGRLQFHQGAPSAKKSSTPLVAVPLAPVGTIR